MTIAQVKDFLAILEFGGFSAAADEMYISQSSLSKQIKALEAEIGLELFVRSNNKVSLTPAGEIFLKYAQKFNRTYTELMTKMSYLQKDAASETVYFGTLPLMQDYHIAQQLATFQDAMHTIQINITEANQSELLKLLDNGKIDLSILRLNYLVSEQYQYCPIQEDKFTLVCSKKNGQKLKGHPLTLKELRESPFVVLSHESDIYHLCLDQFARAGFQPNIAFTTSRHLYILNMVDAGLGFTILPKDMVNTELFPNLECIPFEEAMTTTIGIVKLKHGDISHQADLLYHYFIDTGLTPTRG